MSSNADREIIPDIDWYRVTSNERGVPTRCFFALVDVCPRYFQSLSLLGEAGSTKIPNSEDKRLLKKWKTSDLWPKTDEYFTEVSGPPGSPKIFYNFCPEIIFDRFGYFASSISKYADEIDMKMAYKHLQKSEAPRNHWGWNWRSLSCQHYTDCPYYSILERRDRAGKKPDRQTEYPWYKRHLVEIIVGIIITIIGGLLLKLAG